MKSYDVDLIELFVEFRRQTEKAILVSDEIDEEWIPKSQIEDFDDMDELDPGDMINILIPAWLAEEKGFI